MTEDEQKASGVIPGLIRLSVGIEHLDDIKADLEQAFTSVKEISDIDKKYITELRNRAGIVSVR